MLQTVYFGKFELKKETLMTFILPLCAVELLKGLLDGF